MPYSPTVSSDDIARAVLERDDVADFVRGGQGVSPSDRRQQVEVVLDELKTRQRYRIYRALQHPFYPILRKVERIGEHVERARDATTHGRVIYVSNHKSHLDYLIQPIVIDDNGLRPPLTVAGINLFGGALGFIHRHFTGAIPIRRNSKDPVYLFTLRAYIAEVLKRRDLLFYAEGGRSYSGELKSVKTGLLQAALLGERHELAVVPMAIAYDLVLEERILAREALKKRKRPITQEVAEMVRHAVGYRSRAFVTFGHPIPLSGFEPGSRRDLVTLVQRVQDDDRQGLQSAADGARRRVAAAADDAPRARGARDGAHRRARRRGREPRRPRRRPRGRRRRDPPGRARRHRRERRPRARPRSAGAALLRAHDPASDAPVEENPLMPDRRDR